MPDNEAILRQARDRFKIASEAENRIRVEALEDLRFAAGDQWPVHIKQVRDIESRPCLTINRLPQFIRQVTNDQRQNRPQIKVSPTEDDDIETAEVEQGLCRHIELSSNADVAYDTAFESAATGGFGYLRVVTEYIDPTSFEQEIRIKRIRNPFTVYFDPAAQEPDYSDARFSFVIENITHDEFRERWPKAELSSLQSFATVGDRAPGWVTESSVRIAEYFEIEYKERELALLADGSKAWADELDDDDKELVVNKRRTHVPIVHWYLINGMEVLEERDWPGKYIPIIPVLGEEIDIDGERELVGMVRYARDPQRMYNYWASAETETIALAPKAPFVAAEGQIEGYEAEWRTANVKSHAVLPYKPKSLGDKLVPPPARQVYEPPVQAITNARMQASEDLKATTGIYDASLGAQGNEKSGRAILARQQEGDTANFHLIDNLSRAIRHTGRILIDLIPKIYDTPRILRIVGLDDEPKMVKVNQPTMVRGVEKVFDLTTGKYDVTVTSGPSYSTKRMQAAESMMQLTQAYPPLMQFAGDLMVKSMDWPGAQEIAERLKRSLPPELQDADGDEEQPIPPQVQAQLQQSQELIDALTKEINALTDTINTNRLELESKERIEALKAQVNLLKIESELESRENIALLQGEIQAVKDSIAAVAADNEPVTQ